MSENLTVWLSQKISIPQEVREWATADLPVSYRLRQVFKYLGYQKLADLSGKTYKNIYFGKNCGNKTIVELRDFIAELQSADSAAHLSNLISIKKTEKIENKKKPKNHRLKRFIFLRKSANYRFLLFLFHSV